MKKLLLHLIFFVAYNPVFSQELNTSKTIDSVISKTKWKIVKKVKLGEGKKDWYSKDKNSTVNFRFFVHRDEGIIECIYYNDKLIGIKYIWGLTKEKANFNSFYIYNNEVVDKIVEGKEASPIPLIKFANEYKEEAKGIILQSR